MRAKKFFFAKIVIEICDSHVACEFFGTGTNDQFHSLKYRIAKRNCRRKRPIIIRTKMSLNMKKMENMKKHEGEKCKNIGTASSPLLTQVQAYFLKMFPFRGTNEHS